MTAVGAVVSAVWEGPLPMQRLNSIPGIIGAAAMQFANRDYRTDSTLDTAASDLEALAEEVAAGFRAEMIEVAA